MLSDDPTGDNKTTITVHINDAKKFYKNDDRIEGHVLLKVVERTIFLCQVKVQLACYETLQYFGPEESFSETHYSREKNVLSSIDTQLPVKMSNGTHTLPFDFLLQGEVGRCPPSFNSVGSEVFWQITAVAVIQNDSVKDLECESSNKMYRKCTKLQSNEVELVVYPYDPDAGSVMCRKAKCKTTTKTAFFKFLKVVLTLPEIFPQPPDSFDFIVSITPYESVSVKAVKIFLEKRLVVASKQRSENIWMLKTLKRIDINKVVNPGDKLEYRCADCILWDRKLTPFKTSCMELSYSMDISLTLCSGAEYLFGLSKILIASP